MCDILESLDKLKDVYHMQKQSTQRHFLPEKMEGSTFSVIALPSRHNPFGACKKSMNAKLEGHQASAIPLIALVGFDWDDHSASFKWCFNMSQQMF